jgi:type II secretory ATPase GspE/PulE/Tfp pilus assembly ATPase PilB-like protein
MATSANQDELQKRITIIHRAAEERDAERRAKKLNLPYVDLRKTPVSIEAVKLLSKEEAAAGKMATLQIKARELAIACYDPSLPETVSQLEQLKARTYTSKLFVASLAGLSETWRYYDFITEAAKGITGKVEITADNMEKNSNNLSSVKAVEAELKALDYKTISTTSVFELLLGGALATRASDIHFEAEEKSSRIRYRVDGVLHDVSSEFPLKNYLALVGRIKLLSNLKMNVHGEAQDGRFTISLAAKDVEVRVSIIPSEFGETIVMRVLDPAAINVKLSDLGLRPDDLAMVEAELAKPNGLILNTGPTGSGKTTTLYAFLKSQVTPEIKIITVEDPIEYRIDGIEQTQVNNEVGYTFAKGLRAIVRQDPDVILIGEIRDLETADIALEASLTGHMVLSTLHTNNAVGAVPRLIDVGVKPQVIGPGLSMVIAQRLVRKLCDKCKRPVTIDPALQEKIKKFLDGLPPRVDRAPYATPQIFEPVGCEACNTFGYKGRRGVFEFFKGGAELEKLILTEASEIALKELAKKQQMVMMQEDGVLKVLTGLTTFSEVESATGTIDWLK